MALVEIAVFPSLGRTVVLGVGAVAVETAIISVNSLLSKIPIWNGRSVWSGRN
jgi:hypothetical protein